ncbi:hypothetical protein FRC05_009854 [Tulasnella sp. 425]|nr:hypothetical protein FRC05_009854 [Tulasnella sp. 425]
MSSLRPPALILLLAVCLLCILDLCSYSVSAEDVQRRKLATLQSHDLSALVELGDPMKTLDPADPNTHLSHILIPRPSGSANNTQVRQYIVNVLKNLNWHIEEDTFEENTPLGKKQFTNIIATWDPSAPRRFILSAHFDSKYFANPPDNQFVGATDSAAPCAFILDVAETLSPLLEDRQKRLKASTKDEDKTKLETTLQLVFFDGEEAFIDWRGTDHTYGARHLAEKWGTTYLEPGQQASHRYSRGETMLSNIDCLLLLDLLGAETPLIRSYFPPTAWLFDHMVSAEQRLGLDGYFNDHGHNKAYTWQEWDSFFMARTNYHTPMNYIDDDHMEFLKRGVSILHVIADPFPHVWHQLKDDASALHPLTMKRWALILRLFVAEYFELQPRKPTATGDPAERSEL